MEAHRFGVGEIVLYAERRYSHFTWKVPYTVVSCIRADAVEPQYRIVSDRHPEILTVGEHELCRTPQPVPAVRQLPDQFFVIPPWLQPANLNREATVGHPLASWLQHSTGGGHHG